MIKYKIFYTLFILILVFVGLTLSNQTEKIVSAQLLQGCPKQDGDYIGWQKNPLAPVIIKYWFKPSDFADNQADNQKGQLRSAFSKWTTASNTSCLKVSFVETTVESESKIKIRKVDSGDTEADIFYDPLTKYVNRVDINIKKSDYDQYGAGYNTFFLKAGLHEIGHTMGLDDAPTPQVSLRTVMNNMSSLDINESFGRLPTEITECDLQSISQNPQCATPTPTPTPEPTIVPFCDPSEVSTFCHYRIQEYCDCVRLYGNWDENSCTCISYTPVLVDTDGDGFDLTSAAAGVRFDIDNDGAPEKLAWTKADSDDAWLTLDRNDNNFVDNGAELFGNFTEQPQPSDGEKKNGFLALAEFDKAANGGNGDRIISNQDNVFSRLRLWQDKNHNGASEADELHALSDLNISVLELDYKESKRTDEFGNRFRYRAKVKDAKGAQIGRWAWDVFLVKEQ